MIAGRHEHEGKGAGMGSSVRVAPGVRVRASSRSVRTSIGPGAARAALHAQSVAGHVLVAVREPFAVARALAQPGWLWLRCISVNERPDCSVDLLRNMRCVREIF